MTKYQWEILLQTKQIPAENPYQQTINPLRDFSVDMDFPDGKFLNGYFLPYYIIL
jgi:hypothetical protein